MKFRRLPQAAVSRVGDEYLVLDGRDGSCHILNHTAGWLLSIADKEVSIQDASARARTEFSVAEGIDVEEQIRQGVRELAERQMLDLGESTGDAAGEAPARPTCA